MTVNAIEFRSREVREGKVASFSKRQSILNGDTAQYFIRNPASNDDKLKVTGASADVEAAFEVDINANVTEDTAGSQMEELNHLVSQPAVDADALFGGDYSGRGPETVEGLVTQSSELLKGEIAFVLSPGENVLVEYTNISGNEQTIAHRFEVAAIDR